MPSVKASRRKFIGLVWHGWCHPQYWDTFFSETDTIGQRLPDMMQSGLVVDTLLVVMAFPTLFGLLAIEEAKQQSTVAFKICVFGLATGCLLSIASIISLTAVLTLCGMPQTVLWSEQLISLVKNILTLSGLVFYLTLYCYIGAIPCGFFALMHHKVAAAGTAVFALLFGSTAVWFGHYQGRVLEILHGERRSARACGFERNIDCLC